MARPPPRRPAAPRRPGAPWRDLPPPRGPPEGPVYFDREEGWVRLDQNTNPRTHPVVGRIGEIAAGCELNRYGTARGSRLRRALSERTGLPERNLIVGNGSDELLHTVARAYLGPGRRAALWRPGYDPHAVFSWWTGASLRELPVDPFAREAGSPLGEMPSGFLRGVDLLFHSSPHNPTGCLIGLPELRTWARGLGRGVVVIDQAYGEYARGSGGGIGGADLWKAIEGPGSFLFTRTFSKAWGLAGLRVGWGVGSEAVIQRLEAYSVPFTLDTLAEEVALKALDEPDFVRESVEVASREGPWLFRELLARNFRVLPSSANFFLTRPPVDGARLWEALRERRVLVRRIARPGSSQLDLRITVGSSDEHARLLRALDEALPEVLRSGKGGRARPPRP